MEKLKKYAVVTGASSGIGWHISKELAMKGYSIVAVSNQAEQLKELKNKLETEYSIEVLTIDCDLSQKEAAGNIFKFCQEQKLEVEVLVNNAGILVYGEVVNVPVKRAETILQLHMNTPAILCRLFAELMVKNKKGFILNVSSISAVMPYPTISLYGPTKTFLRQFSRALRTELKGTGVSVLCLLPGATATALYDQNKVNVPLATKLGVMKKPEYVAKVGVSRLLRGKGESVPGFLNKIIMLIVPWVPNFIIRIIYKISLRKR
ncbi:MAG: SDR family NAD(P)-dependent oxidoreductase [Aureispira sp.]|nr:SDR family NAD(P)-dependent oxidoreductase [Aureispira sp.]